VSRLTRPLFAKDGGKLLACGKVKYCFHSYKLQQAAKNVNKGEFYGRHPVGGNCPYRHF
jgi:hypothetical protein